MLLVVLWFFFALVRMVVALVLWHLLFPGKTRFGEYHSYLHKNLRVPPPVAEIRPYQRMIDNHCPLTNFIAALFLRGVADLNSVLTWGFWLPVHTPPVKGPADRKSPPTSQFFDIFQWNIWVPLAKYPNLYHHVPTNMACAGILREQTVAGYSLKGTRIIPVRFCHASWTSWRGPPSTLQVDSNWGYIQYQLYVYTCITFTKV